MNQRRLSFALLACVGAVPLLGAAGSAAPPQARHVVADTGVVPLGPGQVMRLTVTTRRGGEATTIEGVSLTYGEGACQDGVCAHPVATRSEARSLTLDQAGGASLNIPHAGFGVRGVIRSNRRDLRVLGTITDGTSNTIQVWVVP
jgi:hypothetical protein